MHSSNGYKDWEIGNIEIHILDGIYHLFHINSFNRKQIHHATSTDGINWTSSKDNLAKLEIDIWKDDLLSSINISQNGENFELFYTKSEQTNQGISKGLSQKIEVAISTNLIDWKAESNKISTIQSEGDFYETLNNNPREWLSFRDPFKFEYNGNSFLLICARASYGPLSRRGCVGLYQFINYQYIPQKPLFYPLAFDDIEHPCICEIEDKFYLIGSLREDVKVRYWMSDEFLGEYQSFHHDVLLPQGNYAARVVKDGDHILIYNYYFLNKQLNQIKLLPPPKELMIDKKGRLRLKSFYRWEEKVNKIIYQFEIINLNRLFNNPTSKFENIDNKWWVSSRSGYELFTFEKLSDNYIWEGIIKMEGLGKGGFVINTDDEGNGYFISIDFVSAFVEIRNWSFDPTNSKNNFIFNTLQVNQFRPKKDDYTLHFKLIHYGNYIEFSIDGEVKLTLIDFANTGKNMGLYTCSSELTLENSTLKTLINHNNH